MQKKQNPEEWIDLYGDYLYRFALLRLGNNTQLAEDLVQETFLSALNTRFKYQGKSAERTWLVTILKNKIIDHYRRKKEKRFEQTDFQNSDFIQEGAQKGSWKQELAPADWGDAPDRAVEQQEFASVLKKCLSDMPQNMASVFSLRELDGLDTKTICKELSISTSNLWVLLHRARSALRRCLELHWIE